MDKTTPDAPQEGGSYRWDEKLNKLVRMGDTQYAHPQSAPEPAAAPAAIEQSPKE
ncbi:MAG: hypothetical protein AB1513_11455 [Pseudomonadota bacterium]